MNGDVCVCVRVYALQLAELVLFDDILAVCKAFQHMTNSAHTQKHEDGTLRSDLLIFVF